METRDILQRSLCWHLTIFLTHGVPVDFDIFGARIVPNAPAAEALGIEASGSEVLFNLVVDVCVVFCSIESSNQQLAVLNLGDFLGHLDEHVLYKWSEKNNEGCESSAHFLRLFLLATSQIERSNIFTLKVPSSISTAGIEGNNFGWDIETSFEWGIRPQV